MYSLTLLSCSWGCIFTISSSCHNKKPRKSRYSVRDMKPSHIPDSEWKKDVGSVVRNKSIAGRRTVGICFLVVTGTKHDYSRYKTLLLSLILSLYVSPQSKKTDTSFVTVLPTAGIALRLIRNILRIKSLCLILYTIIVSKAERQQKSFALRNSCGYNSDLYKT